MNLHLGCGDDYRDGFINLDQGKCKADVYHDLEKIPYPFNDNQFSLILANQVIEHLNQGKWLHVLEELFRISKHNAIWEFRSPYAFSDNFATDPTHKLMLSPRSFHYFDRTKPLGRLGQIYGVSIELRVLDGLLIQTDRFGPDVYHRMIVIKHGIEPDLTIAAAARYLYKPHSWIRTFIRRSVFSIPQTYNLYQRLRGVRAAK